MSPGHSDDRPGHSDDRTGHSDDHPGHSDDRTGHSDDHPGHSDDPAGHADDLAVAELRRVSFAYPARGARDAAAFSLTDVSFDVRPGEMVGVIGPNSAGKTTLVRLLTGVVTPLSGQVLIDGRPVAEWSRAGLARRVAVVPQELPQSFPFTVGELVLMGRYPHGPARFFESGEDRAIAHDAMLATGVLDLAAVPLDRLSGGERQRAVLARALAQRPRLLVLDEPTAHLDLRYQVVCAALLARLTRVDGVAVVLVSHDLGLAAELSDRLLLLADGRVAALGAPEHVLDRTVLESVFGCPILVDRHPASGRPVVHVQWPEGRSHGVESTVRSSPEGR
jgi:ABC-type cobalamin/Fe3+-siderophores transport system ATPase subunit